MEYNKLKCNVMELLYIEDKNFLEDVHNISLVPRS